ncbi:MAG: hypothetical protein CMJ18_21105 [Phycisphaeraceae bacterium]|nr:hypothetical protein [Phycisphaeraceae bacterium]
MRRPRGFTLIELLVVISIVALLIALLMPAIKRARALARQAICLSNVHQMLMGLHTYAAENGGYFPHGHGGANAATTFEITSPWARAGNGRFDYDGGTEGWTGMGKLFQYDMLTDPEVVYCPSQRFESFSYPKGWHDGIANGYRTTSYHYRLFGQISSGMTFDDLSALHNHQTEVDGPIVLVSDIFHLGHPNWGPYPADVLWAHHESPPGLNLGFSDGHATFRTDRRTYDYAVTFTHFGFQDHLVMLYWQLLDGDPSGVETIITLP